MYLFFFFFGLFRATPMTQESSQARGQIRAAAANLHHSHSNTRSVWQLQATPQLLACSLASSSSALFYSFVKTQLSLNQFISQMPSNSSILVFLSLRAIPMAYGGSQARGRIGAVAAILHHSHSNARSEPLSVTYTRAHINIGSLTEQGQGSNPCPHGYKSGS